MDSKRLNKVARFFLVAGVALFVVALLMGSASPVEAQQVSQNSFTSVQPELQDAAQAGMRAGESKSATSAYLYSAPISFLLPGSGLAYLLFLNSGEVEPNFSEQAFLRDKSPAYIETWAREYDRALTAKQKKAIYIGTGVGSAIGVILFWGPLMSMM